MFCIVPSLTTIGRGNSSSADRSVILVQDKKHLGSIDLSGLEATNSGHVDLSLLDCSGLTVGIFTFALVILFLASRGDVLRVFAIRARVSGWGRSERSGR